MHSSGYAVAKSVQRCRGYFTGNGQHVYKYHKRRANRNYRHAYKVAINHAQIEAHSEFAPTSIRTWFTGWDIS